MAKKKDALELLTECQPLPARPVYALYGAEVFLKRECLQLIQRGVWGEEARDAAACRHQGPTADFRDVADDLSTRDLFGSGTRLVVVEQADPFVTKHRAAMETLVESIATQAALVLDVMTWNSATRLAKLVDRLGLAIACQPVTAARAKSWLVRWGKSRYGIKLERAAAEQLTEIMGTELGILDQELAKLAASVSAKGTVSLDLVRELSAGWGTKTVWSLLDAALAGQIEDALRSLERLLVSGETALAIFSQIAFSLRRLSQATLLLEQAEAENRRIGLRTALERCGVKPFALAKSEAQLRWLGRQRARKLMAYLLAMDLALKGDSSSPERARLELEKLLMFIATPYAFHQTGG